MNQVLKQVAQSLPGATVISDFNLATHEVTVLRKMCPCHKDNHYSLVITGMDSGVHLKCLAGCCPSELWLAMEQMQILNLLVEQDRIHLARCWDHPAVQGVA